jgi:hypothetical protein
LYWRRNNGEGTLTLDNTEGGTLAVDYRTAGGTLAVDEVGTYTAVVTLAVDYLYCRRYPGCRLPILKEVPWL